jgi:hypothetical protein
MTRIERLLEVYISMGVLISAFVGKNPRGMLNWYLPIGLFRLRNLTSNQLRLVLIWV